jgi:hypothetical protein
MCKAIGIESYVISGYTTDKVSNKIPELGHAWNAVKIKGEYLLIDNTWAAGYLIQKGNYVHEFRDEYFLIPPKEFIKTHVPFDPIWQFLNNPISNINLENKDFSSLHETGNFNYKDSIATIKDLDAITQIDKIIKRIKHSGITNKLIKSYVNASLEHLEIFKFNKWGTNYNNIYNIVDSAQGDINKGIFFNNTFIEYFNKRFRKPKISDNQIKNAIDKANLHFYHGKKILKKSKQLFNELQYSGKSNKNLKLIENHKQELIGFITELEVKILEIEPSMKRNTIYSKKYLKKWKPLRIFVPY